MSSRAADIDTGVPMPRALAEAAARLADSGLYGLVWLTDGLIVEKSYGPLVDFVTHDRPVTDSIMALYGLEQDILALRERPEKMLELPAIAVATREGTAKRLNFTLFWLRDENRPMLLAYRANSQTDLELELSRQIRARLMAEAEILQKSRELARANADLESFAAIVSHDLKAPLRHMRLIADDVMVGTDTSQAPQTAAKLRQLQDLSRRMSHMLTELFDYASLGRKYEALAATDTHALAQAIAASFPDSGFDIAIEGHWPVLTTLAAPLDLVLRNLVQNAIQHHDRDHGTITLSCHEEPGTLVFTVADDGPGIPPKHHDAAFLPFRTLGTGNDKPGNDKAGTGMGLAMVKKTVENAGGRIALNSDPAQQRGSRFIIFWPRGIA